MVIKLKLTGATEECNVEYDARFPQAHILFLLWLLSDTNSIILCCASSRFLCLSQSRLNLTCIYVIKLPYFCKNRILCLLGIYLAIVYFCWYFHWDGDCRWWLYKFWGSACIFFLYEPCYFNMNFAECNAFKKLAYHT